MKWEEIDFDAKTWTLPAERGKSGRKHVFPLAPLALRILVSLPRISDYVFPGRKDGTAMATHAHLAKTIKKVTELDDFRMHDARRTFRTALDKLGIPPHIKNECMNHARQGVGDTVYSQHDYLPEQREAFEAWAEHIDKLVHGEGVVGLRG